MVACPYTLMARVTAAMAMMIATLLRAGRAPRPARLKAASA
jgi:hypothetical protein